VTWQEELRALDQKLAAGTISAEEYRRTRDDVLAKTMSQGAPAQPNAEQTQGGPAEQQAGQQPSGPQSGGTQSGGFGSQPPWSSEATQFVAPVTDSRATGGAADRTQVVRSGDADRTQIVPGIGTPGPDGTGAPAGGQGRGTWPVTGQQNWQQQQSGDYGNSGPPWIRPGFEPIASPAESWIRQGPEAFNSGSGNRSRIIGITVAVLLVAGLAVGGVLLFTNQSGTTQASPPPATTQSPPTTTKVKLPQPPPVKAAPVDTPHALVDPPGTARAGGGSLDLSTLATDNLLPKPMVDALNQAGMSEGLLKTTSDNGVIVGLYGLTVRGQSDASTVAQAYSAVQSGGGVPADAQRSMQGVPVFSTPSGTTTSVFRAVYVLYNRVIIVEALGSDYNTVRQVFTQVLQQQVALAPPTVRNQ